MAETKKQMLIFGKDTDVSDVPILKSEEHFNHYELEDGTKLKVKNVATSFVRLEGQFMPDGRPLYIVLGTPILDVESSPLTKKQQ
jgi:hypothetical protein